jgi:SAM-dependent methyltransferase
MGLWQLDLLIQEGLRPEHRLLDLGCGSLRGGIHLIEYLQKDRYFGLDRRRDLIRTGVRYELSRAARAKRPRFLVRDDFDASAFGVTFDFVIAQSVLTHLPSKDVEICIRRAKEVLSPAGAILATVFLGEREIPRIVREAVDGTFETYADADPYHHPATWLASRASEAGLQIDWITSRKHPRAQHVAKLVSAR